MSPFKQKEIEEFNIADCELYISKYPYGERVRDVKKRLMSLKEINKTHNLDKEDKDTNLIEKEQKQKTNNSKRPSFNNSVAPSKKNSTIKIILSITSWIVIIIGIIFIMIILQQVLPDEYVRFIQQYKIPIMVACASIGKLIQNKI